MKVLTLLAFAVGLWRATGSAEDLDWPVPGYTAAWLRTLPGVPPPGFRRDEVTQLARQHPRYEELMQRAADTPPKACGLTAEEVRSRLGARSVVPLPPKAAARPEHIPDGIDYLGRGAPPPLQTRP